MRAETLRKLNHAVSWDWIDTDETFRIANRFWKTAAFRLKAGPLVKQINRKVLEQTAGKQYDLIWVDKGVYFWRATLVHLRKCAKRLVHFTPDTAFYANRSRHFMASAKLYDLLVTTKSFEMENYRGIVDSERVMLVTQAYDVDLHRPPGNFTDRKPVAVFIGLCEPDRERCVEALLGANVAVRVGGVGWRNFFRQHAGHSKLHFLGTEVFGEQYAFEYASASVGLGLLSKRFPELHTTRTFEIPACGTMLATERTADTIKFFNEDEVLFYDNYQELAGLLADLLKQPDKIKEIANKGYRRVLEGGYDYASILSGVLQRLAVFS